LAGYDGVCRRLLLHFAATLWPAQRNAFLLPAPYRVRLLANMSAYRGVPV
jgi:hypothetical protein